MSTYDFQQLLFLFSFLAMIIDGGISKKEMDFNRRAFFKTEIGKASDYREILDQMISGVQENPSAVLTATFESLDEVSFSTDEKEILLEELSDMIQANGQIHPAEWEFLLFVKNKAQISDQALKKEFPDFDQESSEDLGNPENFRFFVQSLNFSEVKPFE